MNFKIAFFVQQSFFKSSIGAGLFNELAGFGHSLSACKIGVLRNLAKPHIQLASAVELINGFKRLKECLLRNFFGSMLITRQRQCIFINIIEVSFIDLVKLGHFFTTLRL